MPYDSDGAYQAPSLFFATFRTALALGAVTEGLATGGSTTTLIDTVNLTQADDFWNGGTVFITNNASGAGSPEEKYAQVTDFVNSTNTATLGVYSLAAIASGDRYGIATSKYPLQILISNVNAALLGAGNTRTSEATIVLVSRTHCCTAIFTLHNPATFPPRYNSATQHGGSMLFEKALRDAARFFD